MIVLIIIMPMTKGQALQRLLEEWHMALLI